jgi:hypothetical protein
MGDQLTPNVPPGSNGPKLSGTGDQQCLYLRFCLEMSFQSQRSVAVKLRPFRSAGAANLQLPVCLPYPSCLPCLPGPPGGHLIIIIDGLTKQLSIRQID